MSAYRLQLIIFTHLVLICCGVATNSVLLVAVNLKGKFSSYVRTFTSIMAIFACASLIISATAISELYFHGQFIITPDIAQTAFYITLMFLKFTFALLFEFTQLLALSQRIIYVLRMSSWRSTEFKNTFIGIAVFVGTGMCLFTEFVFDFSQLEQPEIKLVFIFIIINLMTSRFLKWMMIQLYKKRRETPLRGRFEITRGFDYCSALCVPTTYRLINHSLIIIFIVINKVFNLLTGTQILVSLFYVDIFITIEFLLFPLLFLGYHRNLNAKILKYFNGSEETQERPPIVQSINGQELPLRSNQEDHFDDLNVQWDSAAPSSHA